METDDQFSIQSISGQHQPTPQLRARLKHTAPSRTSKEKFTPSIRKYAKEFLSPFTVKTTPRQRTLKKSKHFTSKDLKHTSSVSKTFHNSNRRSESLMLKKRKEGVRVGDSI